VRTAVIAIAVAYFAFIGVGVYLMVDGQTEAGETLLIMAMAGGWFGSRWVARQRERDER
jgi:uncharacterized membrane protein YfcA